MTTLRQDRETLLRRDRLRRAEINRLQGKLSAVNQLFTSLEVRAQSLAALCAQVSRAAVLMCSKRSHP